MRRKGKFLCNLDQSLLVLFFIGIVYSLFPSINNTNDAYMYAADIREGIDLFYPHHLLYNVLGYVCSQLFHIHDTLSFLCLLNALGAIGCLCVFRKILLFKLESEKVVPLLLLVGSCWGFMRYATDVETYIIPLFFSLAASCCWLYKRSFFLTSLLAAIACLFHQIHFFWWLGLGLFAIYQSSPIRIKALVVYIGAACIVPLSYVLVYLFYPQVEGDNIIHYVFHDYFYVESVGFSFKHAVLLTPVNLIRTLIQVHGYIPSLLQNYFYGGIGIILLGTCLVLFIKSILHKRICYKNEGIDKELDYFAKCHGYIFILQLCFAFLSNGNAEFMVMLPFAFTIYFSFRYYINSDTVKWIALAMFSWNICIGILPLHYLEIYPYKKIETFINKQSPDTNFVISNYPQLYNMLRYDYPHRKYNLYEKEDEVSGWFYTDLINNEYPLSRFSILNENISTDRKTEIKEILTYDLGEWTITKVYK